MLRGTHGTCVSRAESITVHGFGTGRGLRGSGVYFWSYTIESLEDYVRALAIAWWRFAKDSKQHYKNEYNQSCSILYVSFNLDQNDILDLENQLLRDKFIEYSQKILPKLDKHSDSNEEKIRTIYDMFVKDIENWQKKHTKLYMLKFRDQERCYLNTYPTKI